MSYCTFDRFQGIWLGSIIALVANQKSKREQTKIVNDRPQWLITRNKIAEILLEAERLEVSHIIYRLEEILENADNTYFQNNLAKIERAVNSPEFLLTLDSNYDRSLGNRSPRIRLLKYGNHLLSLLPFVIFYGDNFDFFTEIINQCNLKSVKTRENEEYIEDILIWNYLLTLALNNKFKPDANLSLIVGQVLSGVALKKTSLIAKLETIIKAWEQGMSLYQLTEELLSKGNSWQTAIALSFYCFATTPQDFKLSIKRASTLEPDIAWLTTALTGTVSGAYNGITGIPRNWRAMANQNSTYQLENQTVVKLFKAWVGVSLIDSNQFSGDLELHAVATPNIIQPRLSLKIISQKSLN